MESQSQHKTPLMQQYWSIKEKHMDKIMLFRMGDFFEMFFDDAIKAAPLLNITLTYRNRKANDETPMCGVPHHSIGGQIAKLLRAGLKVAICDQIEDAAEAKGIVKRAVTRILTPGLVYDPESLDQLSSNFVASWDESTVAFVDASTQEAFFYSCSTEEGLKNLVQLLQPRELVVSTAQKEDAQQMFGTVFLISVHEDAPQGSAEARLKSSLVSLNSNQDILKWKFEPRELGSFMELSEQTLRHLEVFKNYRGEETGTLFEAIHRTLTPGGSRLLKDWLRFPLREKSLIQDRQSKIRHWFERWAELNEIRGILKGFGDLPRRLNKMTLAQRHPRDVWSLWEAMGVAASLCEKLGWSKEYRQTLQELLPRVEKTLVPEPPNQMKSGGYIRQGCNAQLDEWISWDQDGQKKLQELEAAERDATGISSLKIRFNNVFGYYIEVTNTHKDKVPTHFHRKQTLANAERYTTNALMELEEKILSAQSKRLELEKQVFDELCDRILHHQAELLSLAKEIHALDVVTSLAWLAIEWKYTCPVFGKSELSLRMCRHPVVEQVLQTGFVPNNLDLKSGECLLLTGPNMAGKSTLMRQAALTVLLAQMGSFVPAEKAELPIYDQIFTRIGASDSLAQGLSTFMVEMQETAAILEGATKNSLIILDEIGRGTSTYDGLSLAQSILEFLVNQKKAHVLFATHYHELSEIPDAIPAVRNGHMGIQEELGQVKFLYTLVPGPANRSYGIHVAELAGLPRGVITRSQALLKKFEGRASNQLSFQDWVQPTSPASDSPASAPVGNQDGDDRSEELKNTLHLLKDLKNLPISTLTPLQALNKISEWQDDLSSYPEI